MYRQRITFTAILTLLSFPQISGYAALADVQTTNQNVVQTREYKIKDPQLAVCQSVKPSEAYPEIKRQGNSLQTLTQVFRNLQYYSQTNTFGRSALDLDHTLAAIALQQATAGNQEQALLLAKNIQYPNIQISTYTAIALQSARDRKTDKALDILNQAVQVSQTYKAFFDYVKPLKATLLAEIATGYIEAGQLDKATNFLSQAFEVAKTMTEKDSFGGTPTSPVQNQASVLAEIALRYAQAKQAMKSSELFSLALTIAQKEKIANSKTETLVEIARRYAQAGQTETAAKVFWQAFQTAQAMENSPSKATRLAEIGVRQTEAAKLAMAFKPAVPTEEVFSQAIQSAKSIPKTSPKFTALSSAVILYAQAGYPDQALQAIQSLKSDSDADIQEQVSALAHIAAQYHLDGKVDKSALVFSKALGEAQNIKIRANKSLAVSNLAVQYAVAEQYDKALEIAKTIEIDCSTPAGALWQIAARYAINKQYDEALQIPQLIQTLAEGNLLLAQGIEQFQTGEYQVALKSMQTALTHYRQLQHAQGEKATLASLGDTYLALKDYPKAIDNYQQSLAIAQRLSDFQGEGDILNRLGYALLQAGQFAEATARLRAGIAVGKSVRARGNYGDKAYRFNQSNAYRWLQSALIAQNQPEAALEAAEESRALLLAESLTAKLSDQTSKLSAHSPTLQQIQQIAQKRNITIAEYSILYQPVASLGQYSLMQGFAAAEEVEKLPSETSSILIWVIQPTGKVGFRQVGFQSLKQQKINSLETLVASSRDSIGVGSRGLGVAGLPGLNDKQRLQQLHQLLIQPIGNLLPKDPKDRLVLIPQESLFLVPFAALQDANAKYLIEQHTILMAPSIQILELSYQQEQRVKGLTGGALVVGNPAMPLVNFVGNETPVRLNSLPAAEQEAKSIAQLLGTQALIGTQATETTVAQQMPKARIIHFATHGLLDNFVRHISGSTKNGFVQIVDAEDDSLTGLLEPGAIALTPGNLNTIAVQYPVGQDDGLLTSSEIQAMKLNAELVVLSACDTGGGKIIGDGVVGLSRAFMVAGVPSVVASLWSVPDAPTASLMVEFYRQLQQKPDKAQALRQAMLTTMKQHPDPKDWAAFILIGN